MTAVHTLYAYWKSDSPGEVLDCCPLPPEVFCSSCQMHLCCYLRERASWPFLAGHHACCCCISTMSSFGLSDGRQPLVAASLWGILPLVSRG